MVTPEFLVDAVEANLAGDGGPAWFEVWPDEEAKVVALARHDEDLQQLIGWSAPAGCPAVAVVAGGRAHAIPGTEDEPSRPVPPGRARIVAVVDRQGGSATRTTFADGTTLESGGEGGRIMDAMRRSLGLATPPPPAGPGLLIGQLWLGRLAEAAERSRGPLGWDAVTAAHPALAAFDSLDEHLDPEERETVIAITPRVWTWDRLREETAAGGGIVGIVSPEIAGWMDDGMFARSVLDAGVDTEALWGLVAGALDEDAVVRLAAALDEAGGRSMPGAALGYSVRPG